MSSEKSRYNLVASLHQDRVRSSTLRKDLEDKMDSLSKDELKEQLSRLIAVDEYNLYLGAAALLPLDAATVDMLLKTASEQFREDTGRYSLLGEERLCHIAREFIDRA